MNVGLGYSLLENPKKRAQEAADIAMGEAGIARAQDVFVFTQASQPQDYIDILNTVAAVTGANNIVGASASGVLTLDGEWEEGPSCTVLVLNPAAEEPKFKSFLYRNNFGFQPEVSEEVLRDLGSGLIFGDPALFDINVFNRLYERKRFPIFGGGASAFNEEVPGAPVFFKNNCYREGTCFLGIPKAFKPHLSVSYGCRALSRPLLVSRVRQNLILELSGKPAAEVLEGELTRVLTEARAANKTWTKPLPLLAGILVGESHHWDGPPKPGEYYVRPILAVDADTGGLLLTESLSEGSYLTFVLREKTWAHNELEENLRALKASLGREKPLFGFYFNCAGRGRELYGDENHDVSLIRKILGDFPLVGMFSSFEVAPQNGGLTMHGFTSILAVYTKT